MNLELQLPPLAEQRAIARVLQSVQAARDARRRELDLERERKAALVENLFTHGTGGEKLIQFDTGLFPATWTACTLDQVADVAYGVQAAVANAINPAIGTPILSARLRNAVLFCHHSSLM